MTPPAAHSGTPDLNHALGDLQALGATLIRTFNPGPFPACSRLSRNITSVLARRATPRALADQVIIADIMLRQVDTLQSEVAGLPGIGVLHGHRLIKVADAIAVYRSSLHADAEEVPAAA